MGDDVTRTGDDVTVFLDRFLQSRTGTLGILTYNSAALAFTLEPPVAGPDSIIPAGRYRLIWRKCSPHAKLYQERGWPGVIQIRNVPGHEYVEIHAGNTTKDTEGCILLGLSIDDIRRSPLALARSHQAVQDFYYFARPLIDHGTLRLRVMPGHSSARL